MAKDTVTKILDAAELLFSRQGISATSIRNIIARANVNIASVHYHFGCKHEVVKAVYERRLGPVNEMRMKMLAALEAKIQENPVHVHDIVKAFLDPLVQALMTPRNKIIIKGLMARMHSEPDEVAHIKKLFDDVFKRSLTLLGMVLPHISEGELRSRFSFMIGCMGIAFMDEHIATQSENGGVKITAEETGNRVIQFVAAGFEAPAAKVKEIIG